MATYNKKIAEVFNTILECGDNLNIPLNIGLFAGKTGLSIALLTYATHTKDAKFKDKGLQLIETIFNEIETTNNYSFTYCDGLSGFGWGLNYANRENLIDVDVNTLLEDVDPVLAQYASMEMQKTNYDFLHGAVGTLFYFVSRAKDNALLLPAIEKTVVQLQNIGIKESDIIKWASVIDYDKQTKGYNISLSHGMASIATVLSKLCYVNGIDQKNVRHLLLSCVNYILQQEINKDKYGSFFPSVAIESSEQIHKSRLGWCYGDLGIASALWQAGVALQNETWKNKALEVLLFAAEKRRNLAENFVVDAGLCHGTAGIGHVFHRMWWNTRIPEFKHAADYWMNETLKMARFEDGLAGYKVWKTEKYGGLRNDYGLLEGIAGIGLALLSYYHEIEPSWDECLLL